MNKIKKGTNIRIYDCFEWWSVADCECKYCLNRQSGKRGCRFSECAVKDIKEEAVRREQAAKNAVMKLKEAALCRA